MLCYLDRADRVQLACQVVLTAGCQQITQRGLQDKADRARKAARRKRHAARVKARLRLAAAAQTEGVGEQLDQEDEALFDLGVVRGAAGLAAVGAIRTALFLDAVAV